MAACGMIHRSMELKEDIAIEGKVEQCAALCLLGKRRNLAVVEGVFDDKTFPIQVWAAAAAGIRGPGAATFGPCVAYDLH